MCFEIWISMIFDAVELIFNDVDFSCFRCCGIRNCNPLSDKIICGITKPNPEVCPEVLEDIRTD